MNLARESFYTLIFQISGFICATVAGIIVARALGPENKGILTIAMLCPYIFFVIFNPTIETAIVFHMGKKHYDIKTFAGNAIILNFVLSLIALLFFFITFSQFRESFYRGIELNYLTIVICSVPFYFMLYYFSSILRGNMDIKGYNISNQLLNFSNILLILIFTAIKRLHILEAIIAGISGIVLGGLYALTAVMRIAKGFSFNGKLILKLIKDGCKLYIGSIATFMNFQINFIILNCYANPSEVGFYSVAYAIATILSFFSISLDIGLYPKIAYATMDEAIKFTEIASRQMILITLIAALAFILFSKYIVLIYGGSSFLPSIEPLIILLPGMVILVVPKILGALWLRKGWFFQLTLIATITSIISLISNFLLIPKFKANGAALATSLTYSFLFLIEIVLYIKYVKNNISGLFIPTKTDIIIYRDILKSFKK